MPLPFEYVDQLQLFSKRVPGLLEAMLCVLFFSFFPLFILKSVCVFLARGEKDGGGEIQSNPYVCDAFSLK